MRSSPADQSDIAAIRCAADGGVRFYGLDNEPDRWSIVDRDVHPNPLTYDELIEKSLPAAEAIKAAGPDARVLGPSTGKSAPRTNTPGMIRP